MAKGVNSQFEEEKWYGFFSIQTDWSFILYENQGRYDVPKGHMEHGEIELQTTFRRCFL